MAPRGANLRAGAEPEARPHRERLRLTAVRLGAVVVLAGALGWLATDGPGFGDEGLFLVVYEHWLRAPERVAPATSAYWLSNALGGLWLWILPMSGVFPIRAGALAMFGLSALLAWSRLRATGAAWLVPLLGLTFGFALLSGYRYLEYTVFTSAALMIAGVSLLKAGEEPRGRRWAALAGGLLGLSILLRTPNVLALALAAVPPLLLAAGGRITREGWCRAAIVIVAAAAGLFAGWGAVHLLGHGSYVLQAFGDLSGQSTHSPERLVRVQLRTWAYLAGHGGLVLLVTHASAALAHRLAPRRAACARVAGVAAVAAAYTGGPLASEWIYAVAGVVLLICASMVAGLLPASRTARHHALLGLLLPLFTGLGSAALPWPLLLAMWFTLPVAVLYALGDGRWGRPADAARWLRPAAAAVLVILSLQVLSLAPYLASAAGRRPTLLPHERRHTFADPRLRLMHSSRELTRATDEFLPALDRFAAGHPAVITTNGVPLAVYLAGADSFLGHPYVELVGTRMADRYLDEALGRTPPWPLWVRARYRAAPDFALLREPGSPFGEMPAVRELIEGRLLGLGYELLWQNQLFQIYGPPAGAGSGRRR